MKKTFLLISILAAFGLIFLLSPKKAFAGTLTNAKDVISTSRPSAYTNLAVGVSVNGTQAIVVDNGSRWIASDSATIIGATTYSVTVASMSAANKPASGQRTVYFATAATGIGHSASVIYTPVTAKHTVSFRNSSLIPANGKIQISFPVGVGNTGNLPASDSFSFNGLDEANVSLTGTSGAACSTWTIAEAAKTITCNLSAGVTGPATITINIGSTTPTLINPSKTAVAGTADTWTVEIKTLDSGSLVIDSSKVKIGTIDSVEVYATVDPILTFTIAGLTNAAAINVGNSGCSTTEVINTGFDSSATEVNLGVLGSSVVNLSAQKLTVTTNGFSGYSLTATSSGHLIDPSIGYWIPDVQGTPTANDTAAPTEISTGTPAFGIHPCGLDVTGATWSDGDQNCVTAGTPGTCQYANPSSTFYYTLASDTSGPIAGISGNGVTTVEYAASVSAVVPAGQYRTAMTFVATPTF